MPTFCSWLSILYSYTLIIVDVLSSSKRDYAFNFKLLNDLTSMIANDVQDFTVIVILDTEIVSRGSKPKKSIKRRHWLTFVTEKKTFRNYLPIMVSILMLR